MLTHWLTAEGVHQLALELLRQAQALMSQSVELQSQRWHSLLLLCPQNTLVGERACLNMIKTLLADAAGCVLCRGGRGAQVSRLLALHSYLHGEPSSKPDASAAAAQQAANRKADNEDLATKVDSHLS